MNIQNWAENITKEIYDTWKSKYVFWKPGVKVFYAPVRENPSLAIISYQPGGKEIDFIEEDKTRFENGDFTVENNLYVDGTYATSKKIRSFFDFEPDLHTLKTSVSFPLVFFRSPSTQVWQKDLSPNKQKELEDYSFGKIKEIVATINPEKIFVIGITTYKKLKEILEGFENEKVVYIKKGKNSPMAFTAEYNGTKIFASIHFSGARMSKTDWNEIQSLFKTWLAQ